MSLAGSIVQFLADIATCATKLSFLESRSMEQHTLMHETVRMMQAEVSRFNPQLDPTFLSRKVWG